MNAKWIIVDGNNLLHAQPQVVDGRARRSFDASRWALARRLDALAASLAPRVTIVFDGKVGGRHEAFSAGLEVLFASEEATADFVIERMVAGARRPAETLVVTSDNAERASVEAAGGQTMSCRFFVEWLDELGGRQAQALQNRSLSMPRGHSLGDYFPD